MKYPHKKHQIKRRFEEDNDTLIEFDDEAQTVTITSGHEISGEIAGLRLELLSAKPSTTNHGKGLINLKFQI